jgi:hypothetical protein
MFLYVVLFIILGGYWLFRAKYLIKFSETLKTENIKISVLISFIKRFGLTLLITIASVLIITLIVQGFGNRASSGGFAAFVIIPIGLFLARKIWKLYTDWNVDFINQKFFF